MSAGILTDSARIDAQPPKPMPGWKYTLDHISPPEQMACVDRAMRFYFNTEDWLKMRNTDSLIKDLKDE